MAVGRLLGPLLAENRSAPQHQRFRDNHMKVYSVNRARNLIPAGFSIFVLCLVAGRDSTAGDDVAESPVVRAVEQPLDEAAGAIKKDYQQADEQHEDLPDKLWAPVDDSVSEFNRKHGGDKGTLDNPEIFD